MAQLYEFLVEAELQQYCAALTSALNLRSVVQIEELNDEALASIGMTRPEIRRLKKFVKKHGHRGPLTKLKRILAKGPEELKTSMQDEQHSVAGSGYKPSSDSSCIQGALQLKPSAVTLNQVLGAGEFGTVHCGTWKMDDGNKIQVSVKVIDKQLPKDDNLERFLLCMASIQQLSHAHVVRLYGVVIDPQGTLLVSELAPMKSLADCLCDPGTKIHFPVSLLCDLAVQIADGMNYLESNGFVHRDLAARNVLVFSQNLVKIADHGLTRALGVGLDYYKTNVSISLKLPAAWCGPECIEEGTFTSASDVWSYGVTLWEMFSYGFQPWAGFTGTQIASAVGGTEGQRLNQPERCPKEFYDLMRSCWMGAREERPNFAQVLQKVQTMKATRLIVSRDCSVARSDCLAYSVGDIITVLDKSSPIPGFWRGVHEPSNRTGLFDSTDALPFVKSLESGVLLRKDKVNRKGLDRRSLGPGQRLHADMISGPQNDLRHMGHVGYDGAMFGGVVCVDIPQDGKNTNVSLLADACPPVGLHSSIIRVYSDATLASDVNSVVTHQISGSTVTDVKGIQGDLDCLQKSNSNHDLNILQPNDLDDDHLRESHVTEILDTFDLGPSLMDEVMRVMDGGKAKADEAKAEISGDACISQSLAFSVDDKIPSALLICETESDLHKKLDHCNDPKQGIRKSDALIDHESQKADKCNIYDVPKTDSKISCQPLVGIERIPLVREMGDIHASLPGSHLSSSQSSLKNGIFSKIGSSFGRHRSGEQKFLHSLDALVDPNPEFSSHSPEFVSGASKISPTTSSSLPTQKGKFDSLGSSEYTMSGEDSPSNVIRRTKEKIRSSLASVMSKRRSSLKNPLFPPPEQNLSANAMFFDRLREQMENAEIEALHSPCKDRSEPGQDISGSVNADCVISRVSVEVKHGSVDKTSNTSQEYISPESSDALRDLLCDTSTDSDQLCSEIQCTAKTCDSVVSDCCPSEASQDLIHISKFSSSK